MTELTTGSRRQVFNGNAIHTTGGLEKKDLMLNKWGRIVSRKKHHTAKREKRLEKAGYYAERGFFGAVTYKSKNRKTSKISNKSRRAKNTYIKMKY